MTEYVLKTSQAHNHGKYDDNGEGGYFRFDDDNNMSFKYILSVTHTEMGQLNTLYIVMKIKGNRYD